MSCHYIAEISLSVTTIVFFHQGYQVQYRRGHLLKGSQRSHDLGAFQQLAVVNGKSAQLTMNISDSYIYTFRVRVNKVIGGYYGDWSVETEDTMEGGILLFVCLICEI